MRYKEDSIASLAAPKVTVVAVENALRTVVDSCDTINPFNSLSRRLAPSHKKPKPLVNALSLPYILSIDLAASGSICRIVFSRRLATDNACSPLPMSLTVEPYIFESCSDVRPVSSIAFKKSLIAKSEPLAAFSKIVGSIVSSLSRVSLTALFIA